MVDLALGKISIPADILVQEIAGEAVLLDLAGECYFGLDEVGTRIWQLLNEHGDVATVYQIMRDEFDVEDDQLRQDLSDFITKLQDNGLASVETDATPATD